MRERNGLEGPLVNLNLSSGTVQKTAARKTKRHARKAFGEENLIDISQQTVGLMIPLFDHLGFYDRTFTRDAEEHLPLVESADLKNSLLAAGFDDNVLQQFQTSQWNFRSILPELHDGSFASHFEGAEQPEHSYGYYLIGLANSLDEIYRGLGMANMAAFTAFKESLRNDGYVPKPKRKVEKAIPVVDLPAELSLLEQAINRSKHDDKAALLYHLATARKEFDSGRWGLSMGEWRKFFEEVLRGTWRFTRLNNMRAGALVEKPPIPHTFNFLAEFGFFTKDEWSAYSSASAFLSAGDHPGVGDSDLARFSMTLAMTFGHACLEKLDHWTGDRFEFS